MIHDAKILLIFMQKYGKTLKHDRIFPIFFNFAPEKAKKMKYYEVKFAISAPEELLQDVRDVVSAMAGELGFETFEDTPEGLTGYVQQHLFDPDALDEMLRALPFAGVSVKQQAAEAEDKDWNQQWEDEGFEPIAVGDHLVIHDGRHLPTGFSTGSMPRDADGRLSVEIDAKLAFGTGNHATTRMMADALTHQSMEGKMVLDCGTGTGVLAIVALLLGARRAVGYDIDEWSADNARHNAVLNRVDERFDSLLGDATIIDSLVPHSFDVVVANINRNILLADMPRMAMALKPGGTLLLSGFYQADIDMLQAKAESLGLSMMATHHEGEWAMMEMKHELN